MSSYSLLLARLFFLSHFLFRHCDLVSSPLLSSPLLSSPLLSSPLLSSPLLSSPLLSSPLLSSPLTGNNYDLNCLIIYNEPHISADRLTGVIDQDQWLNYYFIRGWELWPLKLFFIQTKAFPLSHCYRSVGLNTSTPRTSSTETWSPITSWWDSARRGTWSTSSTSVWPRSTAMPERTSTSPTARTRTSPAPHATPPSTPTWASVRRPTQRLAQMFSCPLGLLLYLYFSHKPFCIIILSSLFCLFLHRAVETRWPGVSGLRSHVLQPGLSALAGAQGRHQEAEVWAHQREENVHPHWGALQGVPLWVKSLTTIGSNTEQTEGDDS